jgi:ribosomal protein L37AE/L43A
MAESPVGSGGPASRVTSGRAGDASARRQERLAPLIHDLLSWDLVERTEGGTFVLRDDVQRQVKEAADRQSRPVAQVFVGRPCQRCGAAGVTRMVDGVRTCPACSRSAPAAPAPADPPARKPPAHRDSRSWWYPKVG